jgi:hypothetical protein
MLSTERSFENNFAGATSNSATYFFISGNAINKAAVKG